MSELLSREQWDDIAWSIALTFIVISVAAVTLIAWVVIIESVEGWRARRRKERMDG
jgi:type IV secretory pathway component VirB8